MFPYAFSPPFVTDTANDPETAKTLHSTIRWNKIADVKVMVDSEVREVRPPSFSRTLSRTRTRFERTTSCDAFLTRAFLTTHADPTHETVSLCRRSSDVALSVIFCDYASIRKNRLIRVRAGRSQALANVQDRKNGNRPLHIAAQNGHLELVKFLVGAGADVNAQNAGGQTAMHMATSYDIDAVVKVLNDAGADGSIVNDDGYAAKWGLAGEKDPTSANYFVEQFQGASDEATLARCLDELLKKAEAGEVDKQKFPAIGLKVKKANAASGAWTPAVQAKFVAVVQAEPPSFG